MFYISFALAFFLLLVPVITNGAPEPPHKLTRRVDFETVAFAQEAILEPIQDEIQKTILPELWRHSFTSRLPTAPISRLESLYRDAAPAIRNVTAERVPIGNTILQADVELQLAMRLIRPFLDVLIPLGHFRRTTRFMALISPLDRAFDSLILAVRDTWADFFISVTSAGLVSGVEFELLRDLNMFLSLVDLGLTA